MLDVAPDSPVLLLTGLRRHRRIRVEFRRKPVWLSSGEYHDLCRLVQARIMGNGCLAVSPTNVSRLRREFNQACFAGIGRDLIDAVGAGEYQLALNATQIGLDGSFLDLPAPRVIASSIKAAMIQKLRILSDLLSDCD